MQQKNWRVLQNSAGDGKTLLLAAGKKASFVANDSLVALWLGHNKVVRIGRSRRFVNFFRRRIEPAELDIAEDRIVKQEGLLSDEPNLFAQRFLRHRAQISTIDLYSSGSRIIYAQDQRE